MRSAWGLPVVWFVMLATGSVARGDAIVVIDIGPDSRSAALARDLGTGIMARGGAIGASGAELSGAPPPTCIVAETEALGDAARMEGLLEFARAGGSLVLLFGPSTRSVDAAGAFAGQLGVRLAPSAAASAPVRFVEHAVSQGLESPPSVPLRIEIGGPVRPLAFQGKAVVAAWVELGSGGVALVPTRLIGSASSRSADRPGLIFLTRLCLWQPARLAETLPQPTAEQAGGAEPTRALPPAPPPLEQETTDFAGAILVDARATDDGWEEITPPLLAELTALRLPLKALAARSQEDPLVRAVGSAPPLVVLGCWRELSEQELVALDHYVWAGGRLFVAVHASQHFQARLASMNMLLRPYGLTALFGRARGPARFSAELAGVPPSGPVAAGVRLRGKMTELVNAPGGIVAGGVTYGEGAILAMDVGPLRQAPEYYGSVVAACLGWLMRPRTAAPAVAGEGSEGRP
jgi:hypothetical protein